MKKVGLILVVIQCLVALSPVAASGQALGVTVNGHKLASVVAPVSKQDNLLIPLRTVAEAIGADVDYDSTSKRITIIRDSRQVTLYLGRKQGNANGQQFQLAVAPQTIKETTMVPLRFVSEQLGASVNWDNSNQVAQVEVDKGKHELTAKEYLATAITSTRNSGTFNFEGQSQMEVSAPTQPGSPAGTIGLRYLIAGQWADNQVYFTERNYLSGSGQYGDPIEFLDLGQALRIKVPGGRFEAAGDAEDLSMRQLKQHGALLLDNLEQYGVIANYGNNDEGYEVIWVKLDEDLVKTKVLGLTPGTSAYQKARAVLGYRVVINANTKLISKAAYFGYLVVPVGAKVVVYSGEGSMTFAGFGEMKKFPQV